MKKMLLLVPTLALLLVVGRVALEIPAVQDALLARGAAGMALQGCLLYTSPSPRDVEESRMPSSA